MVSIWFIYGLWILTVDGKYWFMMFMDLDIGRIKMIFLIRKPTRKPGMKPPGSKQKFTVQSPSHSESQGNAEMVAEWLRLQAMLDTLPSILPRRDPNFELRSETYLQVLR